jgi:hypothetical protein
VRLGHRRIRRGTKSSRQGIAARRIAFELEKDFARARDPNTFRCGNKGTASGKRPGRARWHA